MIKRKRDQNRLTVERIETNREQGALRMKKYTWKEAFADALEGAQAGKARSQNFVGYCYDIGRGVKRDLKKARQWYEKAAKQGQIDAIFNLAVVNDKGLGIRRNAARAARLYRQAALRGDLQAQANLAVMLLDGDGIKKNISAGLRWLRRAAQRGDARAQYNLGQAYLHGEGVQKNITYAKRWLSKAAKAGHAKAQRLITLQPRATEKGRKRAV